MTEEQILEHLAKRVSAPTTKHPWTVLGISRATWYAIPEEERPQPRDLGGKTTRVWLATDLLVWLQQRDTSKRKRIVSPGLREAIRAGRAGRPRKQQPQGEQA